MDAVLLLILALVGVCHAERIMPSNCSDLLIDGDKNVDKMLMLINKDEMGYKDVQEFDQDYCRPFLSWLKAGRAYKPCLQAFPAQLLSIILSSMKKTHKTFCTVEDKKQEAWRHLKCLTPNTKAGFQEVGNMVISMIAFTANIEDLDEAIPAVCCGSKIVMAKAEVKMDFLCKSIGYRGSGKWLAEVVFNILNDALDVICGGYSNIEECNKKKPGLNARVEAAIRGDQTFNHTIFIPIVKLIKRLDGQINLNEEDTP